MEDALQRSPQGGGRVGIDGIVLAQHRPARPGPPESREALRHEAPRAHGPAGGQEMVRPLGTQSVGHGCHREALRVAHVPRGQLPGQRGELMHAETSTRARTARPRAPPLPRTNRDGEPPPRPTGTQSAAPDRREPPRLRLRGQHKERPHQEHPVDPIKILGQQIRRADIAAHQLSPRGQTRARRIAHKCSHHIAAPSNPRTTPHPTLPIAPVTKSVLTRQSLRARRKERELSAEQAGRRRGRPCQSPKGVSANDEPRVPLAGLIRTGTSVGRMSVGA
jgi:hypothetical protein